MFPPIRKGGACVYLFPRSSGFVRTKQDQYKKQGSADGGSRVLFLCKGERLNGAGSGSL